MCKKCLGRNFRPVMSSASECGHQVNKASMKWCGRCAISKGLCMHCGSPLQKQRGSDKDRTSRKKDQKKGKT